MPERDAFEARLETAVRSFAERADTHVDAMAVAERAIRRRGGVIGWLGRTVPVPIAILLLLALLGIGTWTAAVGGFLQSHSWTAPAPAPTSTPTPTPTITPSPSASETSVGSVHVGGTSSLVVVSAGETTQAGDVSQVRGIVITTTEAIDDQWASGTGTFHLSLDASAGLGFEWGTARIENADGAWDGPCSGASWSNGQQSDVSCWLAGSGSYEGFTYYWHGRNAGLAGVIDGTILPAPAPSPQ